MKTCPVCGTPLTEDALFCPECGARCEAAAPQASLSFCPSCGQALPRDALCCPTCGQALSGPSADRSQPGPAAEAPVPPAEAPVPPAGPVAAFCPDCGEAIPQGALCCPACGKALSAGAAPGKRSFKVPKGVLIGVGAVAGVAAIVLLVTFLMNTVFATPAQKFVSYQRQSMVDPALGLISTVAERYNDLTRLNTDITLSASCSDREANTYLKNSSVKLQVDLSGNTLMAGAKLTLMGTPALSGTASYNKGVVGLYLPELDEHYYTLDLVKFLKRNGYDSQLPSGYDLDAFGDLQIATIPVDTLKRAVNVYADILFSAVSDDNVTVEDDTVRLRVVGKGRVDAQVYTFEPSAKDLEQMFLRLADALEEDTVIHDLVLDYLGDNEVLLSSALATGRYDSLQEILDDALADTADNLRDGASDFAKECVKYDLKWIVALKDGKIILNSIQLEGGKEALSLECGDNDIALYTYDQTRSNDVTNIFRLTWETEGGLYTGKFTYSRYLEDDSAGFRFSDVDLNRTSILGLPYGTYRISASSSSSDSVKFVVKAGSSGTDHTITLNDYYFSGTYADWVLTVNTSDKASSLSLPGKATDITSYSPRELQELYDEFSQSAQYLLYELQRKFG